MDFLGKTVASDAITPEISRELGLRFVLQTTRSGGLSAADGRREHCHRKRISHEVPAGSSVARRPRARTQRLLDKFEIGCRPDDELSTLRPSDRTMVAIARALQDDDAQAIAALILDEPTASLPDHEVDVLLKAVRLVRAARPHHYLRKPSP